MQKYVFSLKQANKLITIWSFGDILFGCLAEFYLVIWQDITWAFARIIVLGTNTFFNS